MKKTKIIGTVITASASIVAALIGGVVGKTVEQKNVQNEINEVMGDSVNVAGDGNNVTINDIAAFMDDYETLQKENASLTAQNMKYFDELTTSNEKVDALQTEADNTPIMSFTDMALSVEGINVPINKSKSKVTIDGRTYYSEEILKELIQEDQSLTIKNDTVYVGKVIEDQANLAKQWIVDSKYVSDANNVTDSYGNSHSNVIYFNDNNNYNGTSYVVYNINRAYNYLRFKVAITSTCESNSYGTLTVKAGETVVYNSEEIRLTTEPFEVIDIPISDCALVTIDYNFKKGSECILFDAIVYN